MSAITVHFNLGEAGRKAVFAATGDMPAAERWEKFEATELTAAERQQFLALAKGSNDIVLVNDARGAHYNVTLVDYARHPGFDEGGFSGITPKLPLQTLDSLPAFAEVLALLEAQPAQRAAWLARCEALTAQKQQEHREYAEQRAREDAARRVQSEESARRFVAEQAAAEAKREAEQAARLTWAKAHGSDRLRRALERGHDCGRLYAIERAAVESPGYVLDYEDVAKWKDRSCPSTPALDEADRVQALGLGAVEIVWLTEPAQAEKPGEYDYLDEFEPCEAVVIRRYLDRYDLVKTL